MDARCSILQSVLSLYKVAMPLLGIVASGFASTSADQASTETVAATQPAFARQIDLLVQSGSDSFLSRDPIVSTQTESLLLRRIYLCLIGLPPTLDELNGYLNDTSPDRYQRKIDELLAQPEFVEHWAEKLDVMLMERRSNTHVPQDQWMDWLRARLTEKQPLHFLMADLLVADGYPGSHRPAGRFILDRGADPHLVTRDIGRIYFGRDLQCAQCHDHPAVYSYLQTDYHGLLGFVSSIHLVEVPQGDVKVSVVAEKSSGDTPFESVFRRGSMHRVLPHIFGDHELPNVWSVPGEDYLLPVESGLPAKPVQSRRRQLADAIRTGELGAFNRNLVNRLWAQVFGRGIVEPLDLHHSGNPPASEVLLGGLARHLKELNFDLRSFLRELLLTDTYRLGVQRMDQKSIASMIQAPPQWLTEMLTHARQQQSSIVQRLETARNSRNSLDSAFKAVLSNAAALQTARLEAFGNVDSARTAYSQSLEVLAKASAEQKAAEQVLAESRSKLVKLQSAVDSSNIAVQAVGEDAELAAAVAVVKNRMDAASASIAQLEQALTDKTSATQAAQVATVSPREALFSAQASADRANAAYQEAAVVIQQARQAVGAAELLLAHSEARANELRSILVLADLHDRLSTADQVNSLATDETFLTSYQAALEDVVSFKEQQFLASRLTPLSPEQMGWSFLAVNNVYRNYVNKHFAELESEPPETRRATAVRKARAELQSNVNLFVSLYGAAAGQPQTDFFATPDQALYASNGGAIFSWAAASGENVTSRVVSAGDILEAANCLYSGILCRPASDEEAKAVGEFLSQQPDQRARLAQEMVWGLMAGVEFRFLQ